MGKPRTNKTCISELLSVGIQPGWLLHITTKRSKTNYVGPVESMDAESLTLINGPYTVKNDIPIPQREQDRIRIYGTEIDDYSVMTPLLAAVIPRWKRRA